MRRLLPSLFAAAVLLPLGCRVWNNPLDPTNNKPPHVPERPFPDSGATRQDTVVTLSWNGGDPNPGDTVRYDVLLGPGLPPPVWAPALESTRCTVTGLDYSTLYYWQVIAFDSRGDTIAGPLWRFTTWAVTDTNRPPNTPGSPWPGNGLSNIDTAVVLRWSGGDPDSGDVVRYDIHFGPSAQPPLAQAGLDTTVFDPETLACQTLYYWQVKSFDLHGDTATGPVWNFTTAAPSDTNRRPNPPSNPVPDSGATGRARQAVLSWQGGDPDPGDTVKYDVYFGTTTTPPRVHVNLTNPSYSPSGLENAKTYYWRVVSRDQAGDTTAGPLWQFATMTEVVVTNPTGSTRWREGSQQTITWTGGTDGGGSQKSEVRTLSSGKKPSREARGDGFGPGGDAPDSAVVLYSTDNGVTWYRQARATVPGELEWTVGRATAEARIQVRLYVDERPEPGTSPTFVVTDSLQPSEITITSPTRGTRWEAGSNQTITWTGGTDGFDSAVVRYHTGVGEWARQGQTLVPGSFNWTVPPTITNLARVEVTAHCASQTRTAVSDTFRVAGPAVPDTVIKTLPTGEKPQDMVWNSVSNKVYSADYQSGTVSVIDCATDSVLAILGVGSNPSAVAYDATRNEVWVANLGSRSLSVIDGAGNQVLADSIHVGSTPQNLAISPTSGKVYVTNYGADSLTVVDAASRQVVARIATGESPRQGCWHPGLNRLYVPCFSNNELTVIDCATDSVLARVGVGFGACWAVLDTIYDEVWVANQLGGNVSIVDCETNSVVQTVVTGSGPCALAYNPTSVKIYCANKDDNSVSAISILGRGVAQIGVGSSPRSLYWCPVINKLYVGNHDSDNVTRVDGGSNGVEGTIVTGIGDRPRALTWSRTSSKVYCANYGSNSVSVIGNLD